MPNYLEKKWYSGVLELWPVVHTEESEEVPRERTWKCLLQSGSKKDVRIKLVDMNGMITLQHLRARHVRAYGRLVDVTSLPTKNYTSFYLEVEKVQTMSNANVSSEECGNNSRNCRDFVACLRCFAVLPFHSLPSFGRYSVLLEVDVLKTSCNLRDMALSTRCFVLLHGDAASLYPYLEVNQVYSFCSTCRTTFGTCESNSKSESLSVYLICDLSAVDICSYIPKPLTIKTFICINEITTHHHKLLRPTSTFHRETLMYGEVDICGEIMESFQIHALEQRGSNIDVNNQNQCSNWICLRGKVAASQEKYFVYFSLHHLLAPNGLFDVLPSLRRGAVVMIYNVLPTYLWGRLHGFTASNRSQFVFKCFSPFVMSVPQPERSMACDNIFQHSKCFIFTSWYCYYLRRIQQALSSTTSYIYTREPYSFFDTVSLFAQESFCIPEKYLTCQSHTLANVEGVLQQKATVCIPESFHDVSSTDLYIVRGGLDADYVCSILPEIWTTSMLRRFGENMAVDHSRKLHKLKKKSTPRYPFQIPTVDAPSACNDERRFFTLSSDAQASPLRHETSGCTHPILLVGTVNDLLLIPDASYCEDMSDVSSSCISCLSMVDRTGQCIMVLVRMTSYDSCQEKSERLCPRQELLRKLGLWKSYSSCSQSLEKSELIVTLRNPEVIVEIHPLHNEQSCHILVSIEDSSIEANWVFNGNIQSRRNDFSLPNDCEQYSCIPKTISDVNFIAYSLAVGKLVSSTLASHIEMGYTLSSYPPYIDEQNDKLPQNIFSVRAAKMVNPMSYMGETILPCVRGIVVWKCLTPNMGYYHVSESSDAFSKSDRKKRKLSVQKCVIHLRDCKFSDEIFLYLPATHNAAGICMQNFEVIIFNPKLKLAANKRHIYLEYDVPRSCIGIVGVHQMTDTALSLQSNSLYPRTSVQSLYRNYHHNWCTWRLNGRFVVAREITVFMRCNECNSKASISYSAEKVYCCEGKSSCIGKSSPSSSKYHAWWHAIFAFDDGTGELQICLEGEFLFSVLQSLREFALQDSCVDKGSSFLTLKKSVNNYVLHTFSTVNYSHSRMTMSNGYSTLFDSDIGVCSDVLSANDPSCIKDGNRLVQNHRSVQSVYNDYFDDNPLNLARQRHVEKLKQLRLIHNYIQSCSFVSSTFLINVKVIHCREISVRKNICTSNICKDMSMCIRKALGNHRGYLWSINADEYPEAHIRKVKVQCSNVPRWTLENVELRSEALETIKLQCVGVSINRICDNIDYFDGVLSSPTPHSTTSCRAWDLLNKLKAPSYK